MVETLKERFVNRNGVAWIRTHATDCELNALCSNAITADTEEIELSTGQITCPDCIEIVKRCHSISAIELAPEYENEFLSRKLEK
ncbi:hypothetical protein D9M71_692100 [compost metagenome]